MDVARNTKLISIFPTRVAPKANSTALLNLPQCLSIVVSVDYFESGLVHIIRNSRLINYISSL